MKTLRVTGPLVGSGRSRPPDSLWIWAVPGGPKKCPATLRASFLAPARHLFGYFWCFFFYIFCVFHRFGTIFGHFGAILTKSWLFLIILASFWPIWAHAPPKRRQKASRRPKVELGIAWNVGKVPFWSHFGVPFGPLLAPIFDHSRVLF